MRKNIWRVVSSPATPPTVYTTRSQLSPPSLSMPFGEREGDGDLGEGEGRRRKRKSGGKVDEKTERRGEKNGDDVAS